MPTADGGQQRQRQRPTARQTADGQTGASFTQREDEEEETTRQHCTDVTNACQSERSMTLLCPCVCVSVPLPPRPWHWRCSRLSRCLRACSSSVAAAACVPRCALCVPSSWWSEAPPAPPSEGTRRTVTVGRRNRRRNQTDTDGGGGSADTHEAMQRTGSTPNARVPCVLFPVRCCCLGRPPSPPFVGSSGPL
jgi:hypothetical protein